MVVPDHSDKDSKKRFRVVAALIRDGNKVLLTQRWPGKHLGLTWEFPGGKVEAGETDEVALMRELLEELGVKAQVGTRCFETRHGYGTREVHLIIFRCKIDGTPQAIDVKAVEWADLKTLPERNFPPADLSFVQELAADRIGKDFDDESDDDEEIEFRPAQVVRMPDTKK